MAAFLVTTPPTVAIFPWGDVLEDFLSPIGLDVSGFADQMSGGWLFGYVAALQLAGWRPIIVAASSACIKATRLEHRATGAPIWVVPGRSARPSRSPSIHSIRRWIATPTAAFGRILAEEKCAAVIVQEYEYTRFDQLVRLGRAQGIPVFASFQGGDRTLSVVESLVRSTSLRRCAGLIIASAAERARVLSRYPSSVPPIVDIPNPIDIDEWRPASRVEARRRLGVKQDVFLAVNHGRIAIARKGLDILLEAFAISKHASLVIIGSGEDNQRFSDALMQANLPYVRWIRGYSTDRTAMRMWISAADIYVTSSRVEGMPVAPLEAMACQVPIVATDAQGLPDILNEGEKSGGILVPKNDPAALAAAINRLRLDSELRARLSLAARERVETGKA